MKEKIEYILLILNCISYRNKAIIQKNIWLNSLPNNILYYHIIGDINLKEQYLFDKTNNILYVKTKDDYLSLPSKVIAAIEAVSNTYEYKYILKTDDDQILINNKFFNILSIILDKNKYDYGGKNIKVKDHYSTYYTIHNELPKNLFLKECTYCNGRFYFLSNNAVIKLLENKQNIKEHIIEDHCMGFYLEKYKEIKRIDINSNLYFVDIPIYMKNNQK